MGQYRLWLQYREIDQHLRRQQMICKQELADIDEYTARIEKTAMQRSNTLLVALLQQVKLQEHTTNKTIDTAGAQPEHHGVRQESANGQTDQTPPLSNNGQEGRDLRMADPDLWHNSQGTSGLEATSGHEAPDRDRRDSISRLSHLNRDRRDSALRLSHPPPHIPPPLVAQSQPSNFNTQEMPGSDKQMMSAETASAPPEATNHRVINDLNTFLYQQAQQNALPPLPWWLRNLLQTTLEQQEAQQTAPTNQQSAQTNKHVERLFARRTRLVHYNQEPNS